MANRDLNFDPAPTKIVAENPTTPAIETAVMGIASTLAEQSAQSKLLAQTSKAAVGYKQLDAQFRMKYADDPTNADGLKELNENRQTLADSLQEGIPSVYSREWQNKTIDLAKQSDVSNELWTAHQQRTNTVTNVNSSIQTYLDSANHDGAAFGQSGGGDLAGAMNFLSARANIEKFGVPTLGADKTGVLLKTFNKDYVKSFIAGVAETSPVQASQLLAAPEIAQHFTTEERGDMVDLVARVKKQQQLQKDLGVTVNNTGLTDLVNNPDSTYYEKLATIDKMELQGTITTSAAGKARRVIKSSADLDSQTDTPEMANIINQIYDLNANSASNASEYLRGVRNVQDQILDLQASGKLTAPDAGKLTKQMTELTNKRVSDSTQQVGNEFYEANQKFNTLPPEYRGQATRALFYAADGKNYNKTQLSNQADTVIDTINQKRRSQALKIASDTAMADGAFLRSIKASPGDVTATAQKYHISEQEVMRQLRAKHAARHITPGPVSGVGPDEAAPSDQRGGPVVLTRPGADENEATGGDEGGENE